MEFPNVMLVFIQGCVSGFKLGKCHVLPGDSKDKITSVIIASQWPKLVICMTQDYQTYTDKIRWHDVQTLFVKW